MKAWIKRIYEEKYKTLLIISILLVVLAFVQIGYQYSTTGDFVNRGVTLKGGSTITFNYGSSVNVPELESFLKQQFPEADLSVRTLSSAGDVSSIVVESDIQDSAEITLLQSKISEKTTITDFSTEIVGESLGKSFFKQTIIALLSAFILMGIVVFLYFRTFIPSIAVIAAAFSDIIVTLAIFNLTGMKLSTAGIAAFLMLVGYSVDTDMLLTSRVLKRHEGTLMEKIYGAIKTGLTMTFTTIVALTVALILIPSEVVRQIMIILLIGLLIDMIMTWIQNVAILRLYFERKAKP